MWLSNNTSVTKYLPCLSPLTPTGNKEADSTDVSVVDDQDQAKCGERGHQLTKSPSGVLHGIGRCVALTGLADLSRGASQSGHVTVTGPSPGSVQVRCGAGYPDPFPTCPFFYFLGLAFETFRTGKFEVRIRVYFRD